MNLSPRLVRSLAALCLSGLITGAHAQTTASLQLAQALDQQDWDQALAMGARLNAQEIEAAALPMAREGSVPAMWLMGQARYLKADPQGTADWLYAALLGTRMDLGLCRQRQSDGVVSFWIEGLREAVLATRSNVENRAPAIMKAIRTAQSGSISDAMAGWTCRWAVKHNLSRSTSAKGLMLNKKDWSQARQRQLLAYCKEAGLSLSDLAPEVDDRQTILPLVPERHR